MHAPHPPVVFCCGPRAGGNADTAGRAFADGLARAGHSPRIIRLRDHDVAPCRGCGACAVHPHACPLAGDRAEELFAALRDAPLVAFASPIYFYHLPALFKGFIDRAQRHYELRLEAEAAGVPAGPDTPAHVLLVAGRPQGRRLFEGALLTLKYFLWPFHAHVADDPCLLRGFDAPTDLAADAVTLGDIVARGEKAGRGGDGRGEAMGEGKGEEDASGGRGGAGAPPGGMIPPGPPR